MVNWVFNKYIFIKYKNSLKSLGIFELFFTVKESIKFLCRLNLGISILSEAFYGDKLRIKLIRLPNFPHMHINLNSSFVIKASYD